MTPEEFNKIGETHRKKRKEYPQNINVCTAAACVSLQSESVKEAIEEEVKKQGREKTCRVSGTGCLGPCATGPLISINDGEALYAGVSVGDAPEIVKNIDKKPVSRLVVSPDSPFFTHQERVALEHCGNIDPESLNDYLALEGYEALYEVLTTMTPVEVIEVIVQSGLRGRGGGGYPTGLKWSTVEKAVGEKKFVICNADEGDPGAFMDRSMLESDPHSIVEGMAIAGYAVGASKGYVYIRGEYPLAIKRLRNAIKQAEKRDLLGKNICGTPFSFDIELRLGAGAFVCGEETALIASIEGRRGAPRSRPPYPAEYGLWGHPTLINNVETFANVSPIIRRGADFYAAIGAGKSKGTKVFALAGSIRNTGLIEVPMGISLREIVYEIGSGIVDDRKFKAVQTGGPSGGCIPEEYLDMPVDYESLAEAGSIMGSGGMIVMDETSCMVDVARYFMDFCRTESCGKCVPCRVGTAQMYNMLTNISTGKGTMHDLQLLEELCDVLKHTSLCGLGQTSANPVLSTIRFFRDEYTAHIRDKKCPAGVCTMEHENEVVS
ncbi:NuoF family protein [Natronogracilivirga saccharolytica]|uniref:NAD(P)H-dependent oxidoreductase subunit E n=1 Tax=Natronogracilivirga saccharolytica TaxID=2812953 RepID=A0A8J7UUR1_9BACT|nr:NuoF family protein [Natronogracilivirga saccharolytica]MBP3191777.1 NAD(P)H-dependent oxidoreductase subunit E [Natronogracilivirga saccharolytica]